MMTNLAKKCSFGQSFIRKERTTYKIAILRMSTNVKRKTIHVYMERAMIQRVVLIVLVKKGGQRKEMKTSVLRTSMSVKKMRKFVDMDLVMIQKEVTYATVTLGGKKKVFIYLLPIICPVMI